MQIKPERFSCRILGVVGLDRLTSQARQRETVDLVKAQEERRIMTGFRRRFVTLVEWIAFDCIHAKGFQFQCTSRMVVVDHQVSS